MRRHHLYTTACAAVLAVGLAACGGSDPTAAAPVAGDEIRVVDNGFDPANLEVEAGETVTWVWDARRPHDVVGDDFGSEIQESGTFTHTFDEPGTYTYTCTLHGGMDGAVTVTAS